MSEQHFERLGFRRLGRSVDREQRRTLSEIVETVAETRRGREDLGRSVAQLINGGVVRFQGYLKDRKVRVTYH